MSFSAKEEWDKFIKSPKKKYPPSYSSYSSHAVLSFARFGILTAPDHHALLTISTSGHNRSLPRCSTAGSTLNILDSS